MPIFPRLLTSAIPRVVPASGKMDPANERRLRDACKADVEAAMALGESGAAGLAVDEALERQKVYGPNVLAGEKRRGFILEILYASRTPWSSFSS